MSTLRGDVVVLGAGMVGVSVAVHLQKRGKQVVLVDRRPPGECVGRGRHSDPKTVIIIRTSRLTCLNEVRHRYEKGACYVETYTAGDVGFRFIERLWRRRWRQFTWVDPHAITLPVTDADAERITDRAAHVRELRQRCRYRNGELSFVGS